MQNKYKVTRMISGRTEACLISGYDVQDVIQKLPNHYWYANEVIKIELVLETDNIVADFTEEKTT